MNTFLRFLDWIVPRFLTEDVALHDAGEHYEIVGPMKYLDPDERYDAVVSITSFNLFGSALFPKLAGEVRPWPKEAA